MQFSQRGEWWLVSRITGPTHHFLGLRFAGSGGRLGVAPSAAQEADIAAGVALANAALGTSYVVAQSAVDPRDRYQPRVYKLLACELVRHVATHAEAAPPVGNA